MIHRSRPATRRAPRSGRAGALPLPALLLLAAVSACAGGGGSAAPGAAIPPDVVFAPDLRVRLAEMERMESGLYLETLRPGEGPVARRGQTVLVHYEGWLPDGTMFDSSRRRSRPLEIPLGLGAVIEGWDEGLVGMRVGEVRRLVIPPELAYGDQGAPGAVPPGATLVFEIELLGMR